MSKKGLTYNTIIISFGKSIVFISSIVIGMILSRYLSIYDYGVYKQVFLVNSTLISIFTFGIPQSINYFMPQLTKNKQKVFVFQTYLFLLSAAIILSILQFTYSKQISLFLSNPQLEIYIKLFSISSVVMLPICFYQEFFICIDKASYATNISIFECITKLVIILCAVLLKQPLFSILTLLLVAALFPFVIIVIISTKYFSDQTFNFEVDLFIAQMKYAIPIGISSIVGLLTLQIDKFIISYFFRTEQYAIYANGAIEVPLIGIITGSIMAVLTPELVLLFQKRNYEGIVQVWHKSIVKTSLILIPTFVFLMVFAEELITFLYSSKYIESAFIFRIFLFTLLVKVTTYGTILLIMGYSRRVLNYAILTLLINSILGILFIKIFGFIGPSLSTVFVVYLMGFLQLQDISGLLQMSFKKIFPWKNLFVILGISLIAILPSLVFKIFIKSSLIFTVLNFLSYIILFLLLAMRFSLITINELKSIAKQFF